MKVKELMDRIPVDEITLKITDKQEPRKIPGKTLTVCECTGEDDTGKVIVTLWNDEIRLIDIDDTVKITKGWASRYDDELTVSAGKFGKIEVVDE
ncbi:MAG: hypothetical protein ABIG20_03070 [archaeon]